MLPKIEKSRSVASAGGGLALEIDAVQNTTGIPPYFPNLADPRTEKQHQSFKFRLENASISVSLMLILHTSKWTPAGSDGDN